MAIRTDFFVGLGPNAEWIGSIKYGDRPEEGWGERVLAATSESEFRAIVEEMLSTEESSKRPAAGWPWVWPDCRSSDFVYAWDPDRGPMVSDGHHAWVTAQQYRVDGSRSFDRQPLLRAGDVRAMRSQES